MEKKGCCLVIEVFGSTFPLKSMPNSGVKILRGLPSHVKKFSVFHPFIVSSIGLLILHLFLEQLGMVQAQFISSKEKLFGFVTSNTHMNISD